MIRIKCKYHGVVYFPVDKCLWCELEKDLSKFKKIDEYFDDVLGYDIRAACRGRIYELEKILKKE
jgi:hypothetical protein